MSQPNQYHVSRNISSANKNRSITTALPSRSTKIEFVNYTALDKFRRETVSKEEETHRTWKTKYVPWLIDEYRKMYESLYHNSNMPLDNHISSLKRSEWQQPPDTLPPLRKRLSGQRRRRILGSFPQTENDKIGWRLLPEHAIDKYGSSLAHIPPLPNQYKFSSWPVESFY